jgi:hypothetical protein
VNTYELEAMCTCPADQKGDMYRVTIKSQRMLWTDKIGAAVARLATKVIPQEEYTTELARELGAHVETVGVHPSFDESGACSPISVRCVRHAP